MSISSWSPPTTPPGGWTTMAWHTLPSSGYSAFCTRSGPWWSLSKSRVVPASSANPSVRLACQALLAARSRGAVQSGIQQRSRNNVLSYAIPVPAPHRATPGHLHHQAAQCTKLAHRRQHKRRRWLKNPAVVKKCRSANYFARFTSAKSVAACGKSRVLALGE
ncbi:conserved hypothetical protein [Ricinus communis]|uniref:Uncharacterized protein n=1 Tax=Ricinus communis TaxID=3988 RepID=B9TID7_RICCO|nr:conserved hypothetical protein [Ricinus communis]